MTGAADPAIGSTYYADNAFISKKPSLRRRPSDRRDSAQSDPRGRDYSLSRIRSSRDSSESPRREQSLPRRQSRRRSYSRRRRNYSTSPSPRYHEDKNGAEKPWFKKKTFWATVASIASVASVAAVSMSTQATRESAKATRKSAKATLAAAEASHRSADASTRIADGNDLSTRAVVNTAVANGHQDHRGRYLGPVAPKGGKTPRAPRLSWDRIANERERGRSDDRHSSRGHLDHKPYGPGLLEYQPIARA